MQISSVIVQPVPVNVVDNFTTLRSGNPAMLPLAAAHTAATLALFVESGAVGLIRTFNRRINGWWRVNHLSSQTVGDVAAPQLSPRRHASTLVFVGIERITVTLPHLVMAHAHFSGSNGAFAVLASPSDNTAAPLVFRGAVLLDALEVHQAIALSGMFSAATIDRALAIKFGWGHVNSISSRQVYIKAIGNGMAVPVIAWIGRRIQEVEKNAKC
jgi:hypothetical protein